MIGLEISILFAERENAVERREAFGGCVLWRLRAWSQPVAAESVSERGGWRVGTIGSGIGAGLSKPRKPKNRSAPANVKGESPATGGAGGLK